MRVLSFALLATLLVSPNSFAARTILNAAALAPATMEELARVRVAHIGGERAERAQPTSAAATFENAVAATVVVAPQPAAAAPPVTSGFQAVTDPLTDTVEFWGDPADASGAVSAQYLVGSYNNGIVVQDRAGKRLSAVAQEQFWHDSLLPDKFIFDPRVAYDAATDRWVAIILGDDTPNVANGVLFIGISATGNPAGAWQRYRIPVDPTAKLDGDISHLAITADKIVITVNIWNGVTTKVNTAVLTVPKSVALAGPGTLPVTSDMLPPANDLLPLSSEDATVRLVEWLDQTRIGTFELLSSGAVANSVVWTANVPITDVGPCAQLGTTRFPQCGGILLSGIARNGTLWVTAERYTEAALVWRIKDGAATAYVLQDSTRGIAFPSVAVNRLGAALVGYVLMSSAIYLTAGYSYIDPAGNMSAPAILKSGEAPFFRDRWGDFTTTLVDPVDNLSFWTLGVYANTPFHANSRWATWWGYMKIIDNLPARHHPARH